MSRGRAYWDSVPTLLIFAEVWLKHKPRELKIAWRQAGAAKRRLEQTSQPAPIHGWIEILDVSDHNVLCVATAQLEPDVQIALKVPPHVVLKDKGGLRISPTVAVDVWA